MAILRIKHNEPIGRWHIVVVLAALGLFEAFVLLMILLFPQGG